MAHPSRRVSVNCIVCGKEKSIPLIQYTRCKSKEFFCSSPSPCKVSWHTKLIDAVCSHCKSLIKVQPFRLRKYSNVFCSQTCLFEFEKKKETVYCDNCGEKLEVHLSRIKNCKTHFCNSKCMGEWRSKNWIGENHHAWGHIQI